ncbi:MAG: NAD(P)-dependent oxidoreductase [Gemmatimonadetes bacterium]|jgi:uronate dehydrogenase|nr:NAD(P)-dependent oxidoreductase [Gemmatimonadota bacterium]MBT6149992.1 NAD(P)-dependent oxidoreductase [Gemmatimonadota bacterium]MBT7858791.1 NAD(P)-dependent oxidoreductase [Gemmatimonadota bacterium]
MRILITGADSALGRALAAELAEGHQLRLLADVPVEAGPRQEVVVGSLTDADVVWSAVREIDAVLHTGEPPQDLPANAHDRDETLLDLATRGTHILCKAAVEAGVKRIVYGSSLDLFEPYPLDVYITEMWKPKPTPQMASLSRYLGERTCREFAREFHVGVTALRLGTLVLEEEVVGQTPDLLWLDVRDAARAFVRALDRDVAESPVWSRRWAVYHVCSRPPNPRYLIDAVTRIGFEPEHNFEANWKAA